MLFGTALDAQFAAMCRWCKLMADRVEAHGNSRQSPDLRRIKQLGDWEARVLLGQYTDPTRQGSLDRSFKIAIEDRPPLVREATFAPARLIVS
jgi:hypothetical protein